MTIRTVAILLVWHKEAIISLLKLKATSVGMTGLESYKRPM